jgi:hypothetical protein
MAVPVKRGIEALRLAGNVIAQCMKRFEGEQKR